MQKLGVLESDYPTFNEVKDTDLKVWNRCAVMFNAGGKSIQLMKNYLKQFSPMEVEEIKTMIARIRKNGYDKTKQEIIRANNKLSHEELDFGDEELKRA